MIGTVIIIVVHQGVRDGLQWVVAVRQTKWLLKIIGDLIAVHPVARDILMTKIVASIHPVIAYRNRMP